MAYWWVNHNQTYRAEIRNGYIWSPENNNDGSFNQTYLNLTLARQEDIVFSFAETKILAIGIVEKEFESAFRPEDFGETGRQWSENGWLVRIQWHRLTMPFTPKEHIKLIAPFLPGKYSPIRSDGNGNQGVYLAAINNEMGELLVTLVRNTNSDLPYLIQDLKATVEEEEEIHKIENDNIPETQKKQLINSRIGQGYFRLEVESIEQLCRVTEMTNKSFLIASHIKPWKDSTNLERLDGNNGLLLSPHVDKLFDRGFITFKNDGKIYCADKSIIKVMSAWGLDPAKNVGAFRTKQRIYLAYHQDVVFENKRRQLLQIK
jgi:hypothetical protein